MVMVSLPHQRIQTIPRAFADGSTRGTRHHYLCIQTLSVSCMQALPTLVSSPKSMVSVLHTLVVLFTSIAPTSVWLLPRLTTDVTCIRHLSPKSEDSSACCASSLLFYPSRTAHVLLCNLLPMHNPRSYRLYRRRLSLYPEHPFE
jgi:hypothetical protein